VTTTYRDPKTGHRLRAYPLTFGAWLIVEHLPDGTRRYVRHHPGRSTTVWTRAEAARYSLRYVHRGAP
jgi:hypothetical protein